MCLDAFKCERFVSQSDLFIDISVLFFLFCFSLIYLLKLLERSYHLAIGNSCVMSLSAVLV